MHKEGKRRSGLRRHMKSQHGGGALTPTLSQEGEGDAAQDVAEEKSEPRGAGRKLIERALVHLGIEWDDVMSYQVHDDRIVIVEGPVGFKRTWWMPASGHDAR